jgi:hypothetical protein
MRFERQGGAALAACCFALLALPALAQPPPEGAKRAPAPAAAGGAKASAPNDLAPTWFGQAITTSDSGMNVTYFWSKEQKLRAETVVLGRKLVTIVNGDRYVAWDGLAQVGLDLGRAKAAIAADAKRERPFGNELERAIAQGAEKVGEEQIQGVDCDVYRITDERGRREVWVLQSGSRLPVRTVVFDRGRGSRIQTDWVNWQRGIPIEDGFFRPESGIRFERKSFEDYTRQAAAGERSGPVPILYIDLLAGGE